MSTLSKERAEKTIRSLGLILSNSNVYGPQHGVTRNATDGCYQFFSELWREGDITIHTNDDDLTVNDVSVEGKNPVLKVFVDHLASRSISNFTLKPEMTRDQFSALIEILLAKPDELQQLGNFNGAIATLGLSDVIVARNVTYVQVDEDEMVVDKEAAMAAEEAKKVATEQEQVECAAAYLSGDQNIDAPEVAEGLRKIGSDAKALSSLVLESAKANDPHEDEMGKAIADCLHRLYDSLTSDPTFHTQKTKKQIHKTLVKLEKELLGQLKDDHGNSASTENELNMIRDTIETMEDELTIDTLSLEYTKRRSAIGSSEKRLLRYIRNKGVDRIEDSDLKSRLIDGGLAPEDWQELLQKSGITPEQDPSRPSTVQSHDSAAVGAPSSAHLNALLQKIEADVGAPGDVTPTHTEASSLAAERESSASGTRAVMLRVPEAVLEHDLHAVQEEVNNIILKAEKRIEQLVKEVKGGKTPEEVDGRETPNLSQDRLFELLGELGQELCQPLSVINCSVDAIKSGALGEVNKVQSEMLDLSASSADKLKVLINKIMSISGVPQGLSVNKELQRSLYQ